MGLSSSTPKEKPPVQSYDATESLFSIVASNEGMDNFRQWMQTQTFSSEEKQLWVQRLEDLRRDCAFELDHVLKTDTVGLPNMGYQLLMRQICAAQVQEHRARCLCAMVKGDPRPSPLSFYESRRMPSTPSTHNPPSL